MEEEEERKQQADKSEEELKIDGKHKDDNDFDDKFMD